MREIADRCGFVGKQVRNFFIPRKHVPLLRQREPRFGI
jgi:hypothetical protein